MANPPPARRRSTSSGSGSGGTGAQRPVRKTGMTSAVRAAPLPYSGPKLVVTAGPMAGEEFDLEDEEYVIGRATDNAICIQDTSVSRKHVILRRVGSGWTVADLGSGNGTLVNGEPITDETPVASGDVITLGDTEVTFTDKANSTMMVAITPGPSRPRTSAPSAAPARPGRPERVRPGRATQKPVDPSAQRKKKIMMGLVGFLAIVLAGGLVALQMRNKARQEEQMRIALADAKRRELLGAIFQDAKNHIRESKWTEAKARLLELKAADPGFGGLQDYLDRVEKEIPNQEHVAAAQAALAEKQLGVAKAELDKISSDTTMFEMVGKLKRELQDKADAQTREARALLDGKQLDPAKRITDDVLVAFPEHRDARLINEEAVRLIKVRDTPEAPPPPPRPVNPWEQAVTRFVAGDLSGAVALANACVSKHSKCKALLKDMTEFGNLYKKLEDLDVKGLSRLMALDKAISGDEAPSQMGRNAGKRAANAFYKSASSARAAGQWSRAVDFARKTLQADPGHAGAANILNELKAKGREIYLQAYALKDSQPDEAVVKFKEVLAMTPPGDETHEKAKKWLEQLSR
ncbi:MAG: FHA domain-containing protein [Myxococcaceae bacterium]|nr:FHA domain-containing protein [Myxococcaceae bacterium]